MASNLAPNQATLSVLAAAHARAGSWGRVGEVLRHMAAPSSGAPPAAATYAPLFAALADAAAAGGDGDKASACARCEGARASKTRASSAALRAGCDSRPGEGQETSTPGTRPLMSQPRLPYPTPLPLG